MSNGSGKNKRYCNNCRVRFTIYARRVKRKYYCPVCGDCIDVVRYEERDTSHEIPRRPWTTKEKAELKRLLDKGYLPKELATRFGRTESSIRKQAWRIKEGAGVKNDV